MNEVPRGILRAPSVGLGIGKQRARMVQGLLQRVDGFFAQTIICCKWKKLFVTIKAMLLSCSFSYLVLLSLSKIGDCFNGCNALTPSAIPAGHLPGSHPLQNSY
jgi:hypothetical protein